MTHALLPFVFAVGFLAADRGDDTVPVTVRFNGQPAAGAKVWALLERDAYAEKPISAFPPAVAGPDGVARVAVPVDGESRVKLYARNAAGHVGGTVVRTRFVSPDTALDLWETKPLAGRVVGTDGKPIAGVRLTPLTFTSSTSPEERNVSITVPPWDRAETGRTTDADGRFTLPDIPVGLLLYVDVVADGYGTQRGVGRTDKPLAVTLAKAGALRVTFRGADPAGTKKMPYYMRHDAPGTDGKDLPTDGTLRFFNWHVGEFDGTATHAVSNLSPGEYSLSTTAGGPLPVMTDDAKFVVKPGETAEVALDLRPLAKVTGRVVEVGTGAPVVRAGVRISPADMRGGVRFPHRTALTAADGRYTYYAPAGHAVVAEVVLPPDSHLWPEVARRDRGATEMKLTAEGLTAPDLVLRRATAFTVTVVNADGKPVAASVYPGYTSPGQDRSMRTGRDGVVSFKQMDPNDMVAVRVRSGDTVNVPEAVEVGDARTQRVVVSKANAAFVAGRITDPAGKPLPGATVAVHWSARGVGKASNSSISTVFQSLTTDAGGRYRSSALWPTDEYWVQVTAEGYAAGKSASVYRAESKTHELDVQLAAGNLAVVGRVVDLAGKPVAGATVFNRGDGEKPMQTTTAGDGTFTLRGYRTGPGFVFAQKVGHRLAVMPADPGGQPVTLVLRTTSDPPAPLPDMTAHTAAVEALTKGTMDMLWTNRDKLGGYERSVFGYMLRYDRATAATWADGKPDFAKRLKTFDEDAALFDLAKTDPDEAVDRLADRKGRDGYMVVQGLVKRLRLRHPQAAARLVEDLVQKARAMDMPERVIWLGEAGYLAARCGNRDAGRKIVEEAVTLAETLGTKERAGFNRGWTIAYLAPFDRDRTVKLLDAEPDAGNYDRYLAHAIDRLAAFDPAAAMPLLDKFRAGPAFYQYEGRMFLAYRLAATDPDKAQSLVASVKHEHYRTLGYIKLAELIGRKDRPRSWRVLDAALADYDGEPSEFDSWMSLGGRAAVVAVAAATARDIGYPNASGFVARALALRQTGRGDPGLHGKQILPITLSFSDPAAARRVLEGMKPAKEFVAESGGNGSRERLFAVVFVLPELADPVIRSRLGGPPQNTGLSELADALTAKNRLEQVAFWGNLPKTNGHWEE